MPSLSTVISSFFVFCSNLSPMQLWFVIACIFLLFLFLAYRTMGLGGLIGVLLIGFFAYVLFDQKVFKKYEDKQKSDESRMEQLDKELQKGNTD